MGIPQDVVDAFNESNREFDSLLLNNPDSQPQVDNGDYGLNDDGRTDDADENADQGINGAADTATQSTADEGGNWQQRARVAEGRLAAQGSELRQLRQLLNQMQANISNAVQSELDRRDAELRAKAENEARQLAARQQLTQTMGLDDDSAAALENYLNSVIPKQSPANIQQDQNPASKAYQPALADDYAQTVLSAFPNYDQLINSQEFENWKFQTDPVSGTTRFERMLQANRSMDAPTIISMMSRFMAETRSANPRFGVNASTALKSQVSPGRSRNGSQEPTNQQKYLTPEQMSRYSEQAVAHMRSGNYTEAARINGLIEASMKANKF